MNLVRNLFTLLATAAVQIPIQFAISVVLARYLSVEDRGLYAVAVTFAGTLTLLFEFGFGPASIYRLRRVQSPPARVVSAVLTAVVSLSLLAVLIALPLEGWISQRFLKGAPSEVFYLALAIVPLHMLWIVGSSLARGLDRFVLQNGSQLLTFASRLVGVAALLILLDGALHEALLVYLMSVGLGMLTVMAAVLRQTGLARVDTAEIRASARFGIRAYVVRSALALQDSFGLFMIAFFLADPQQPAFYAVAVSLVGQLRLLPMAISAALFPKLAGTSEKEVGALAALVARHTLAIVLLGALVIGAAAPLIPWIYGPAYASSIPPFMLLLFGVVFYGLQGVLMNYFGGVGRQRALVRTQLVATGLNMFLNVLLVPRLGILGAACANLTSNATSALLLTIAFSRDSGLGLTAIFRPRRSDLEFYRRRLHALRRRFRR